MLSLLFRGLLIVLLAVSVRAAGRGAVEGAFPAPIPRIAALTLLLLAALFSAIMARRTRQVRHRGAREMSFREALARALPGNRAAARTTRGGGIYFGGLSLPPEAATSHFAIVGSTGSGKSLTLRMLMGSALPGVIHRADQRAVVYDVKKDTVAVLQGILAAALAQEGATPAQVEAELSHRLILLNPFDRRCHDWAIAEDVDSPELALQTATILIPEEQGPNRYFSDAARDLLTGVMNVFIEKSGGRWTLADLLIAMRSSSRLEHVLSQTDAGRDLIELHLLAENTTRSVISTARSKLAPFDVVGALWSQARREGRTISLQSFLRSNQVLVLGNHQAALAPIRAINRVVFQRLTELILDQSEDESRRTWFVLDEVRKLEKLDGLDDLMTNGRSKGACVVLGFQAIEGMEAVYGREVAGEIISMCGSFGVLRVAGARTPQWASEVMGEQEVIQRVHSHSETLGGGTESTFSHTTGRSEQIREKRLFLPSHFRMVPRPERGKPLCGYFCSAFLDSIPYRAEVPPQEVAERLPPSGSPEENFQPWPASVSRSLPSWSPADYRRLGLPALDDSRPHAGAVGMGPVESRDPAAAPRKFIDPFDGAENQPGLR